MELLRFSAVNNILTGRTIADHREGYTNPLFRKLNVFTAVLRQILVLADSADIALPTGKHLINGLAVLELAGNGEFVNSFPVQFIGDTDRDLIQIAQRIQNRKGHVRGPLYLAAIAGGNQIQPAHPARTARGGPVFAAIAAAAKGSSGKSSKGGSGSKKSSLSREDYTEYVRNLTAEQRRQLFSSENSYWSSRREEIYSALGKTLYDSLKKKYGG